jgi:hypothetical protein
MGVEGSHSHHRRPLKPAAAPNPQAALAPAIVRNLLRENLAMSLPGSIVSLAKSAVNRKTGGDYPHLACLGMFWRVAEVRAIEFSPDDTLVSRLLGRVDI